MSESDLAQFRRELDETGQDYQLLALTPQHAHYRFIGPFAGGDVIWDAQVNALGDAAREQFIDIGQCEGDRVPITIGLLVSTLHQPDLLKTMMMIRQYRRLQPGRHVFRGPAKE